MQARIDVVEEWSKEHPKKTMMQDFFEKHPNALKQEDETPRACPWILGFVKEIALQAGWDGVKDQKGRRLLSDIKDALERYDDIPNKKIDEFIQSHPDNIIFVNAREPHNIEYYQNKYNARVVIVTNPNATKIQGNHADENVDDYNYDVVINNSGTLEDLRKTAKWFLTNFVYGMCYNYYWIFVSTCIVQR